MSPEISLLLMLCIALKLAYRAIHAGMASGTVPPTPAPRKRSARRPTPAQRKLHTVRLSAPERESFDDSHDPNY